MNRSLETTLMNFAKAPWIAALLAVALLHVTPARAETFNTCAGFIETLPVTISTQGVWCLKKDLATSMTSGNAITIASNNVTIDCNDFKIGGLSAGSSSLAIGIYAGSRLNATVRNCTIRGFMYGMFLDGAGHLVEDNRLDQNLHLGIYVPGENHRVQRNAVYDTGGDASSVQHFGIYAGGDVIDNVVAGVFADTTVYGISAIGSGNEVSGNRVRALAVTGTGKAYGITAISPQMTLANNRVSADVATMGIGILGSTDTFCTGNTVVNFETTYTQCAAIQGNLSLPTGP